MDSDLFVREKQRSLAFILPAALRKADVDITLWHRRIGHASLDAVKQTAKVVKGLDFVQQSKPEHDEICPPCEKGRPLRFVNKTAISRAYYACNCMHIDVFKITPKGINSKNYGAIVTDEKHETK